jgi:hypothetical protein
LGFGDILYTPQWAQYIKSGNIVGYNSNKKADSGQLEEEPRESP